jgi:aldehyde dehydrogenase (NAD+)
MTAISAADFQTVLSRCGIALQALEGKDISVHSPIDGTELASLAALPGAQVPQS